MTIITAIFGLLFLFVAISVLLLLRPRPMATLYDLEALFDTGPDRYAHLARVLGPEDFEFLTTARRGDGMVRTLRRMRVACMRQYLEQMRADFNSLIAIGSLFAAAPTAQAEKFAVYLLKQRLYFVVLFAALRVRLTLNAVVPIGFSVAPLDAEIRAVRKDADRILRALTPNDMGALRQALRST